MRSVWITGCFGFIGHHLSKYVRLNIDDVVVYGIGRRASSEDDINCVIDDVKKESLDKLLAISSTKPDVIFHCAGTGSVGLAHANPHEDFLSTVCSVSILLDWVRLNSPDTRVVVMSSAAIYGASYSEPISENAVLFPASVYGYSKLLVEQLCQSYIENFGIDIICARVFSVYGTGLKKQLFFDVCSKLVKLKDKKEYAIDIFGTGCEVRDWVHISDVVSTLCHVAFSEVLERNINIGTGLDYRVCDAINFILDAWYIDESKPAINFNGISREGDPKYLVSNNALRKSLYSRCDVNLRDGISEYVKWFKECYGY